MVKIARFLCTAGQFLEILLMQTGHKDRMKMAEFAECTDCPMAN